MAKRPRLLLLDAGAVFAALSHEAWDALIAAYEVVIPATVVRVEAQFYVDQDGHRIEIDLPAEVAEGRIREAEMTASEISAVKRRFTDDFRDRLDDGELEAIAYLLAEPDEDIRFVSADGPAIQAVAMVDDDARVISLAEALDRCGHTKPLRRQFSREFVEEHQREGTIRRIQNRGLASDENA